jgi:salicylate hydroxylase
VHYFIAAGRLHNVVCVVEEEAWTRESWTDPGDPDQLRAAFAGWHPVVGAIIDALDRPLKWALFDRPPLPRWSDGPVTLLGDACHPMLPYGAQAIRRDRATRVQDMSRDNGRRFHLPDGPDQQVRDAAMASSFGLSPEIDWLYGHDPMAGTRAS